MVGIFSPGHGMREHYGHIAFFSTVQEPDAPDGMEILTEKINDSVPRAFLEDLVLPTARDKIVLVDPAGKPNGPTSFPKTGERKASGSGNHALSRNVPVRRF